MSQTHVLEPRIALKNRLAILGLFFGAVAAYLIPLRDADRVVWLEPAYHPEYYRETFLPFTGYVFPTLLLAVFAAATMPYVIGASTLPRLNGVLVRTWSSFSLAFLGVLAMVYVVWLAFTPIF